MWAAGPMARNWSPTLWRSAVASSVREGRSRTRSLSAACEQGQGGGGVAGQGDLGRVVAPDLVGVDVEVDEALALGQAHALAAGADGEHDVGGVDERLDPAVDPGRADRERVAVVDGPLALPGGDHRGLQELDHGAQLFGRPAEHHAAAGDDDRALRRGQQVGGLVHQLGIGGHRGHVGYARAA